MNPWSVIVHCLFFWSDNVFQSGIYIYILDVAFSKLRNSRVREIETAPRFPDHALIFSRAVYSRATPSIWEPGRGDFVHCLDFVSFGFTNCRQRNERNQEYVCFLFVIIIIYIPHQIIYLYNYMIIHLLAKSNSLLPQSPNVTFKHWFTKTFSLPELRSPFMRT